MPAPAAYDSYLLTMFTDLELTPREIRNLTTQPSREPNTAHTPNPAPPQTLSGTEAAC